MLEQDPLPGSAEEDCAFLTFFCSKPKVDLTVSAGPGSGEVPSTNGLSAAAATKKLEAAGFAVATQRVNSSSVEEGLVVFSEPRGGDSATNGSTVTIFVSSGPKLAKVPVLVGVQREVAVQRIRAPRPQPERLRRRKLLAEGAGDPPVAERRHAGRTGLDGVDRRLQRRRRRKRRRCRT